VREELRQCLNLNNSSHDKKKAFIEELTSGTRHKFVDNKDLEKKLDGNTKDSMRQVPTSQQAKYPLLKPITFTNLDEDDYLESGVWVLKKE